MLYSPKKILQAIIRMQAKRSLRFSSAYQKICQPNGIEWAAHLKHHRVLYDMGEDCVIQTNVTFTDPKHVRLGNNVRLTGCILFGHDGSINMLKKMRALRLDSVGKIDIKDNVFIGHNAIIMPNISIGPNAIVAAGAIVTRDVPPDSVVAGVPAKKIKSLEEHIQQCQQRTQDLPWCDHPQLAADYFGPPDADLTLQRSRYFFENS